MKNVSALFWRNKHEITGKGVFIFITGFFLFHILLAVRVKICFQICAEKPCQYFLCFYADTRVLS